MTVKSHIIVHHGLIELQTDVFYFIIEVIRSYLPSNIQTGIYPSKALKIGVLCIDGSPYFPNVIRKALYYGKFRRLFLSDRELADFFIRPKLRDWFSPPLFRKLVDLEQQNAVEDKNKTKNFIGDI